MNLKLTLSLASVVVMLAVIIVVFDNQVMIVSMLSSALVFCYIVGVIKKESRLASKDGRRVSDLANSRKNRTARLPFSVLFVAAMAIPTGVAIYSAVVSPSTESIYSIVISFGMGMTFLFSMVNLPLSIYHKLQEKKIKMPKVLPSISVIVPAYNEELLLARTLDSLIECDYPSKEVIVIDDGSKDGTYRIAARYAINTRRSDKTKFIVARKENGGKASAINFALRFATGEIVIVVDADSIIGRDALKEMVKNFTGPDVVAVGGNVKVMNRWNLLTKCQALEYITGINLLKRAFDFLGVVMIVPGALGAFRKKALMDMGSYDTNTLTEDFDATLKVLKSGNAVQASSDAISYTEGPTTLKDLYKQRIRWNRGNLQTMLKHSDVIKNQRLGMVHDFGYPVVLLTMLISPFLGFVVSAFTIMAVAHGLWEFIAISFAMFAGLQVAFSAVALAMEENEDWKLLILSPLFVIGYKQFQDFVMIKGILDVLLRRKLTWTSAQRSGIITKNRARSTVNEAA